MKSLTLYFAVGLTLTLAAVVLMGTADARGQTARQEPDWSVNRTVQMPPFEPATRNYAG